MQGDKTKLLHHIVEHERRNLRRFEGWNRELGSPLPRTIMHARQHLAEAQQALYNHLEAVNVRSN